MFDPLAKFYNNGTWSSLVLNVLSGVALCGAAAWFSFNMFSTRDSELPVRVINSITLEPTILLAGKPFQTHVNVTLNKLCPYEVRWSLARKTDGLEVVRIIEPARQPPAQIGTQDLPDFQRYVPQTVEPGEYRYIAEVVDLCPGSHAISSTRRDVSIIVR